MHFTAYGTGFTVPSLTNTSVDIMKKLTSNLHNPVTGLIILLVMAGCQTNTTETIRLNEDEQTKEAVFRQILSDEALLNDFLNELSQSEEGMNLLMAHGQFLRQLYSKEFTSQLVRQNPDMRAVMIQNMMAMMQQDTSTYNDVNQMMDEFHESMGEMR